MKYALVLITHAESATLTDTINSFYGQARPLPFKTNISYDDGQLGFCANTRAAWANVAQDAEVEYVFWLEHDFRFLRSVNLEQLASVLDTYPLLAQMALMRDAINDAEREAGGTYRFHRFDGVERITNGQRWLEHTSNLTTNPSLMRREFMRENPWPEHASECEGRFSHDLRERGYRFGSWDVGEVYVEHTGVLRTGHSY